MKYVLSSIDCKIFLIENENMDEIDMEYYNLYNVEFVNLFKKNHILKYLPKISNYLVFKKNLKELSRTAPLDYIHIHYVGNYSFMRVAYKIIRKSCKKLILTFWGSDILNINKSNAKKIKKLIKNADTLVCGTKPIHDEVIKQFGIDNESKIKKCIFGNVILTEENDELSEKINKKEKTVIAIGYNGSKRQQHIKVIKTLSGLPEQYKKNIYILVQASYGNGDIEYLKQVELELKNSGFEWEIITKYLNVSETIALRKNVDIFIHAQTSDAMSASVLEYIYYDTFVLNPKWIEYDEWKEMGINYIEYENFDDIRGLVIKIIDDSNKLLLGENKKIIKEQFSWLACADSWRRLYDEKEN